MEQAPQTRDQRVRPERIPWSMNTGSGLNRSAIQSEISRWDAMSSLTRPAPRIPTSPAAMNGSGERDRQDGRREGAGAAEDRRNGFASLLQMFRSGLPPPAPRTSAATRRAATEEPAAIALPGRRTPAGDRGESEEEGEADRAGASQVNGGPPAEG